MTVRMIGNDEHYGEIGFGSLTQLGADDHSAALLPAIAEPDLVIKAGRGNRRVLEIDIDDVLVWDNREWIVRADYIVPGAGLEGDLLFYRGGITKDNTSDAGDSPTADTIAEGTRPGGVGAAITGQAANPNTALMAGDEVMPFVKQFDFGEFRNEENAAGEINVSGMTQYPKHNMMQSPYEVNGITVHYLMTAAHYWAWIESLGITSAGSMSVGASVRRMSVDVEELFFDRAVLLSILDALVLTN